MFEKREVTERYWSVCWAWIFPYPCRKTRTVTKFCCEFQIVHERCFIFRAVIWGCCDGKEYRWTRGCFGWFNAFHPGPITVCFNALPDDRGPCTSNSLGQGTQTVVR